MNTISTALSGMNAAALQLGTSANNIANSLTPEYRRQTVAQQAVASGGVSAEVIRADVPANRSPKTSSRK